MNSRVLPLTALFAAIAIFFLYVNPTWSVTIAETKAAIASDDQALTSAAQYMAHQNQLAAARNAMDPASLERLAVFLPDSVDNVGLILDLNALAAKGGLLLSNIDVTKNATTGANTSGPNAVPTTGNSPIGSVNLSLSAVGTYTALQAFLKGVEMSERLLDVQDIAITGSDTGVYTYKMTLRLYWLR